jgi:excisionase family DNA binding protein
MAHMNYRTQESQHSAATAPTLATAAEAMQMLRCGRTKLYQLIDRGEIDSLVDGKSRLILIASIHARTERLLAAARKAAA